MAGSPDTINGETELKSEVRTSQLVGVTLYYS